MSYKLLNVRYSLVTIGSMLLASATFGFAYNFLSQSGFDDATTGTTISLISLLGVFVGPFVADIVDRSSKLTQKMFIAASMVVCAAFCALLLVVPAGAFLILPVVVIAFMSASVGVPLLNGMAFIYEKAGGVINYGLCRGLGSAAFAVGSAILGRLWAAMGRTSLPIWCIVCAVLTLVAVMLMPDAPKALAENGERGDAEKPISIFQFFSRYKNVTLVVLALLLMYFCHYLIQTYMAKIIGTFAANDVEGIQGTALFIQAMSELPTMFGFSLLMRKFGVPKIIVVASVFFTVKHAIVLFTSNTFMLYGAMALQMVSFAAIFTGTVYLANDYVGEADRNKGQAVFASSGAVGMLLSSFLGGWLFQFLEVRPVLVVGVVVSTCGTLLMVYGIRRLTAGAKGQ